MTPTWKLRSCFHLDRTASHPSSLLLFPLPQTDWDSQTDYQHEVAEDQQRLESHAYGVPGPCLDEVAANPEVDYKCRKHEKMRTEANPLHACSLQETVVTGAFDGIDPALLALSLDEVEEVSGELHRRLATALRSLDEEDADYAARGEHAPRWHVASLLATTELAAATLGAVAASASAAALPRSDRHLATVAALMYAAPTIPALLSRLEQDRRLLTSLARGFDTNLDVAYPGPWGHVTGRHIVVTVAILDAARCALLTEQAADAAILRHATS